MAKGSVAKDYIFKTILKTFEGSFMYNGGKECRIPFMENGELVQVKVTLTAAKENVERENGDVPNVDNAFPPVAEGAPAARIEVSEEEKQNIANLMSRLGL